MATGTRPKNDHKKKLKTSRSFAFYRLFSLVFALFGLSVSDRFWPSVFALFRTIRLLPFSGCHLHSPENSAQSFSDRSFWKPLRVMDIRAFGSWMSAPKCLFFKDLTALTEVLCRGIRANDPPMSAGCPSQKLPDFSFL